MTPHIIVNWFNPPSVKYDKAIIYGDSTEIHHRVPNL